MYIKYRFKNDMYVGCTNAKVSQILQQHFGSNRLQGNNGNLTSIDRHMVLYDKNRANVGAIFLTFTIAVDGEMLSSLMEGLQVATSTSPASSGNSPATSSRLDNDTNIQVCALCNVYTVCMRTELFMCTVCV